MTKDPMDLKDSIWTIYEPERMRNIKGEIKVVQTLSTWITSSLEKTSWTAIDFKMKDCKWAIWGQEKI